MANTIVLFGGTFDPVHHGHLIVARALAEQCGFERITLVPAASPPHKPPAHASPQDRLAMLRLAVRGDKVFDICDLELGRTGPSYTLDTLLELQNVHGRGTRLRWVIGADMIADLPDWHRVSEVLEIADLIIAARPPWSPREINQAFAALKGRLTDRQIGKLRNSVVSTPLIDISSTQIRQRVSQGKSIRYLVPQAVDDYILRHRLYGRNRAGNGAAGHPRHKNAKK